MFQNYLKIALRNLMRNKGFSIINILGLAVGMASAILILLWMQQEVSYDRFHDKEDRIFEAWNRVKRNNQVSSWNWTPRVLATTLKKDFPEVEHAVRIFEAGSILFQVGDKSLMAEGDIADSTFLKVFSFPLMSGNATLAMADMHSIVLTESLAKRLFGNENPIGKLVKVSSEDNFRVTGVLKNLPQNTRFEFDFLIPWSYARSKGWDDEYWGNNSTATYVLLKKSATAASINPKLKTLRERYDKDDPHGGFFLYPITRWHLYSSFNNGVEEGGRITMVKLFGLIAMFILLIACINFMNLSTARSEKRAKEVGIRKVSGAQRRTLILQFISESFVMAVIAGAIALIIVQLSLPAFNRLADKELAVPYGHPLFWLTFAGFVSFTGLLAGSYPAFFLSAMKPVKVLKGVFRSSKAGVSPRKALVVLQFTIAIVLIISTIIVKQQINYAQQRESGYDRGNLIYHGLTEDLTKNYASLKNELLALGVASSVTKTSSPITEGWSNTWGFEWAGKDPNDKTTVDRFMADDAIARTAGLTIIEGRDFDLKTFSTDSAALLLNESAVKLMNLKEPIGQIIKDNGRDWHVVGVVKDFILHSPFEKTVPMVIEGAHGWFNMIHIKLNKANTTADNLRTAEAIFKKYNPAYPFQYKFADEEYARKFYDAQRIGALAALFTGLIIFISCLGLFGLASYMAQNRVKEIGVRKVLGASVAGIAALLSKDFLKLVLIALVIASPIAWWAMRSYLQDYDYRVDISGWVFISAGALSVLIALVTVGYQAVKAALANPVKSLRTE